MTMETREYSALLYALADEIRREEGCVTEAPERIREAAYRLDCQTIEITVLKRQSEKLLAALCLVKDAYKSQPERLISGDGICADNEVWIHDCAEAIRARGDTK